LKLGRGACEVLAGSLRTFPSDPKIALHCLDAMCNLVIENDTNREILGAIGCCQEITLALKAHLAVPKIVQQGLACISSLASSDENKLRFSSGGCEAVVEALTTHGSSDPSIGLHGCMAVFNLAINNSEITELLGAVGACEAVIAVMKAHVGSSSIASAGCCAIFHLALNANCKQKLLAVSALQAVSGIVASNPPGKILSNANNALYMLRSDPSICADADLIDATTSAAVDSSCANSCMPQSNTVLGGEELSIL